MHEFLLVIAGGSLVTALLKFIEFIMEHFNHKKERKEDKIENIEDLRKEMKGQIDELREAVLKLTDDSLDRAKYEKCIG